MTQIPWRQAGFLLADDQTMAAASAPGALERYRANLQAVLATIAQELAALPPEPEPVVVEGAGMVPPVERPVPKKISPSVHG